MYQKKFDVLVTYLTTGIPQKDWYLYSCETFTSVADDGDAVFDDAENIIVTSTRAKIALSRGTRMVQWLSNHVLPCSVLPPLGGPGTYDRGSNPRILLILYLSLSAP